MPARGSDSGHAGILLASPSLQAIAGALGTQTAEIKVHRKLNMKKSDQMEKEGILREMYDEYETVEIQNDKYSTSTLRISCLSDPKQKCYNELNLAQRMQLGPLQERFRTQQSTCDTLITQWDAISSGEKQVLAQMGVMYVEQIAAFKDHEYYKLGNGGEALVKKAQRHVASKNPDKQEQFDRDMAALLAARQEDAAARKAAEERMFALEAKLAALEAGGGEKPAPKQRRKAGVQEEAGEGQ